MKIGNIHRNQRVHKGYFLSLLCPFFSEMGPLMFETSNFGTEVTSAPNVKFVTKFEWHVE